MIHFSRNATFFSQRELYFFPFFSLALCSYDSLLPYHIGLYEDNSIKNEYLIKISLYKHVRNMLVFYIPFVVKS